MSPKIFRPIMRGCEFFGLRQIYICDVSRQELTDISCWFMVAFQKAIEDYTERLEGFSKRHPGGLEL